MKKIIDKTVNLDLVGVDGNAFVIMGVFQRQARREGWTQDEIDAVLKEAKSSDYNYLLATIFNHCEVEDENKKLVFAIFTSDVADKDKYSVTIKPTSFFDSKEEAENELERICIERNQSKTGFVVHSLWKSY